MVDLAVGMIIGSAFTSIVNSLVNDIFMPVLSIFTGKIDFTNMFIALDGNKYPTLEAAKEVTATSFNLTRDLHCWEMTFFYYSDHQFSVNGSGGISGSKGHQSSGKNRKTAGSA